MSDDKALTYSRYLRIDELLSQQQPKSAEHDELLFIIVHQVYELWFKQILHELQALRSALTVNEGPRVLATLKRVLTILKTLVAQVDVIETMTPLSFNAFRSRLESSSGFQSAQFRAVEFMLGYKRDSMMLHHPEGSEGRKLLEGLYAEATIYDAFLRFLQANGTRIPADVLQRDVRLKLEASGEVQQALLRVYREQPFAAQVCERLVDLDEGLQEWRYRHVKMVERTIGARMGTGGSAGAAYLRDTLFQPLFPDLWAIRSQL
jgi:tryptophan 2,3-dioxygenase